MAGRMGHPHQTWEERFFSAKREDDWALIGAAAALFTQEMEELHGGWPQSQLDLATDAWGDAINGGIVIC